MLRWLVKEHFLEVCFEQNFERKYSYALVKKKWSDKREVNKNYALRSYIRRRGNGY